MLAELSVHNLVIVQQALLQPGEGLLVISGETGAGKSLLLDAIDIVSGSRVRNGLVGRWGDVATVSAVFHVDESRATRIAAEAQIPVEDGQIILRRRISTAGRSQAWINDVPVTAAVLRAAADHLIDLHSQHEPIRLANPAVQVELLDAYAGDSEQSQAYREIHAQVQEVVRELAELVGGERESVKELDYLTFQLKAFTTLNPTRGELATLEQRHVLLNSAGTWRDQAAQATAQLADNDQSVTVIVGRLLRRIDQAPEPRLAAAAGALRQALEHLRDAAAHCQEAVESIDTDPRALAHLEERIDLWNEVLRKHGPNEEALFAAWESIAQRVQQLSGLDARRAALAADLAVLVQQRQALGQRLADARSTAFSRLAVEVHAHLAELGMPKARIHLRDEPCVEPTTLGIRHQELLVCTNPGIPPGTIRDVASGGEAARLMLALSATLAAADHIPLIVYDEVDSGVGGRLGAVIGEKLARLSSARTVLVVTHTPQVAAYGLRQYVVRKHQGEDQTVVTVEELNDSARQIELSEMLGGGSGAIVQAQELLMAAAQSRLSQQVNVVPKAVSEAAPGPVPSRKSKGLRK